MRILYGIQGTGNGHVSRARDIVPLLAKYGQVDLLVSGTQCDVQLPYEIKYRCHGMSFVFGKKGGVDYVETYKRSNVKKLFAEIKELSVHDYDVVISDFEPVTAWACFIKHKASIGLSHQIAVCCKHAPKPPKADFIGKAVLQYYAPATHSFGFHFLPYDKNIFTPVIRKDVRLGVATNEGHYTVYLPSYSDERIIKFLSNFPQKQWQVFSKHCKEVYAVENILIQPISNEEFIQSMMSAEGVLCGAGFETPAEVLYLQKKLAVIPMKGQYEQQCNAAALKMLGVPVIKNLKPKRYREFGDWLQHSKPVTIDFPDEIEYVVDRMIKDYLKKEHSIKQSKKHIDKPSKFRDLLLKKIFYQS